MNINKCNSCNKPNVNKPICDDCNFHEREKDNEAIS